VALHGTAMRCAAERRNLDESIEELRQWGHCEGVALSRYDQVVHDWLDGVWRADPSRANSLALTGSRAALIRSHLATPR
jgi:hypothetical protein